MQDYHFRFLHLIVHLTIGVSQQSASPQHLLSISSASTVVSLFQVFLSSRAVYVIVFNLCHDLYSGTVETTDAQSTEQENIIVSSFSL